MKTPMTPPDITMANGQSFTSIEETKNMKKTTNKITPPPHDKRFSLFDNVASFDHPNYLIEITGKHCCLEF